MPPTSHQTVRLARGRHQSPDQGACVMELASMLAVEPFSDHPQSVCPVIGAFLRAYNDGLPDDRRQDLYDYAARVVGTVSGRRIRRERARRCLTWLAAEIPGARAPSTAVAAAGRLRAVLGGPRGGARVALQPAHPPERSAPDRRAGGDGRARGPAVARPRASRCA